MPQPKTQASGDANALAKPSKPLEVVSPSGLMARSIPLNSQDSRQMIKGWIAQLIFIFSVLCFFFSLVVLGSTIRSANSSIEVWAVKYGTDLYRAKIVENIRGAK